MHSIKRNFIQWEDKLVEVKQVFWIHHVKDVNVIKEWLDTDVLLQRDGKYYFCETLQEADIIEEFTNEELSLVSSKTDLDVPNE
jgi:hypothetical protein